MHPVRESAIFSMTTCLTQAAHGTVQNVTVQTTLLALPRILINSQQPTALGLHLHSDTDIHACKEEACQRFI